MLHDDIDKMLLDLDNAMKALDIAMLQLNKVTGTIVEEGRKRELKLVVDNESKD